jgi:hypothetical protein
MPNIYYYNDLSGFKTKKVHNVKSNLCTKFFAEKEKFCGNYCSRKTDRFNRRCWRHPLRRPLQPAVVLLMISASERTFNRDVWLDFLWKCEKDDIPLELVIYHEDMENATVREPQNFISRFRPFPDVFGKVVPLRNSHGTVNFAQIYIRMLEYGIKIPNTSTCIVLTERTVPIRHPKDIYEIAKNSKCHIDISYNVSFKPGTTPHGLPQGHRGKPFSACNNLAQGLFTTEFLRQALPAVPVHCKKFGITLSNGVYKISDPEQFRRWQLFTGSNPSEFWLINSYLLQHPSDRPMKLLKRFMEKTVETDKYTVAEVPQTRDNLKRTFVFRKNPRVREYIDYYDNRVKSYYKGLRFNRGVSLRRLVRFLVKRKRRALFFRQVELP